LHVDSWKAVSRSGNERLGRVDGADGVLSDSANELSYECAWAAADIEDALSGSNAGEVGELR
jgi:hypothetical protein